MFPEIMEMLTNNTSNGRQWAQFKIWFRSGAVKKLKIIAVI